MMRVPASQLIFLDPPAFESLETRRRRDFRTAGSRWTSFRGGHSRRSSFADSLSASSNRKSSLPAEESRSIWSSQRPCSRTRNHWTMGRYSSGVNPSIARRASSTIGFRHSLYTMPAHGRLTRNPETEPALPAHHPGARRCRYRLAKGWGQ